MMSAAHISKMSAELSAAQDFHGEREREREHNFFMSDSYSDSGPKMNFTLRKKIVIVFATRCCGKY